MEKRSLIAALLSILVLFAWQAYIARQPKPQSPPGLAGDAPVPAAGRPTDTAFSPPPPPVTAPVPAPRERRPEPGEESLPAREIAVKAPVYEAILSTRGAAITAMTLKKFRRNISPASGPVELVSEFFGPDRPLAVSFAGPDPVFSDHTNFQTAGPDLTLTAARPGTVEFFTRTASGVRVRLAYTFTADSYLIGLRISMENDSSGPISGQLTVRWTGGIPHTPSAYDYTGPVAMVGGQTENISGAEPKTLTGNIRWAAYEDKYFIAAMIPRITAVQVDMDRTHATIRHPLVVIPPRGVLAAHYELYLGPKDLAHLKALQVDLERAIDYGWFHAIAKPLALVLKALFSFTGNYGIAIVLLTLGVRLLLFPLNQMSYKSMKEMQKIQPLMAQLREKYKNPADKDKLNREMMDLYKTHKVNPFGGCLPLLIQMPIFIALYQALMKSIELRHAPFVWWINDLSAPEHIYAICVSSSLCFPLRLLPLIMGVTMFVQQKMTPQTGDPAQAKMMLWMMPIMMTVFFWGLPSGLVLYWTVNNLLSIAQQSYINRGA